MRVEIDVDKIIRNIKKAEEIADRSISLMFKDFYEDVFYKVNPGNKIFSKTIENSICYSIGKATKKHKGCFILSYGEFLYNYHENRIREFYLPINAKDDREGLSVFDVVQLCKAIKRIHNDAKLYGIVTSGCLNEKHPSISELEDIWRKTEEFLDSISIGGSFWLAKDKIPEFVSDIRIGEYMLFGTIPYDEQSSLLGENSIEIKAQIIGVYPEREQVIIDCGYTMADVWACNIKDKSLGFVDCSSEYAILKSKSGRNYLGEEITIIPNYKSLVKLKDAERYYIQRGRYLHENNRI